MCIQAFRLIKSGLDVQTVIAEIDSLDDAWHKRTGRQERCFAQAQTNSIPLRGLARSKINGRRRRDVIETRFTSVSKYFPETVKLLEQFAAELDGVLGRAKLARLPPGAEVLPHVDRGFYYLNHDRYHLVIDSPETSILHAGGETARMKPGELWWFDNKALHSAENRTPYGRTHLIFDVRPRAGKEQLANKLPNPVKLFEKARSVPARSAIRAVGATVRLYDAIRYNPKLWGELLSDFGCLEQAKEKPITTLGKLVWPDLEPKRRGRRTSALAWCLANMDIGRFDKDQVEERLRAAGGIKAVDKIWNSDRETSLYGDSRQVQ